MILTPALLLPLRFVDVTDRDKSFDGDFALNQVPYWKMGQKCYLQKFQSSDRLVLQLVANEELSDLLVLNENGNIVTTIQWTASDVTLQGDYADFIIYEIDFALNSLQEGIYVIQQDNFEAQAIDLRDEHPNTMLITYTNDENDNSVVFTTGIVFQFRVEGGIGNYAAKNVRDVYINQIYNPTQLKSIAHREFTLYVGFQDGVPEWVLDRVNIIMQCNEVKYDGIQYQPINEAEFETVRADDLVTFVGGKIQVEPTNNFIKFETGNNPQQITIRIVRRSKRLESISGNQTVSGVFQQESCLQMIVVYKSGVDYYLKVGTTPGGNEISEFLVDSNNGYTENVNYPFNAPTTVYLSGTGLNADSLSLVYDQLDAPEVPVNATAQDEIGKGATAIWSGTSAELGEFWDTVTGLGKPNTKWAKWCIAGTNGTQNYNNAYAVGIDVSAPGQDYSSLGSVVGANEKAISRENLPAESLGIFAPNVVTVSSVVGVNDKIARARAKSSSGIDQSLNYEISRGEGAGSVGKSAENLGSGTNFNVQPLSIKSMFVVKIIE